uniref:RING-type domain-containing protein n=1 Tax=Lotharella oceanica TaxID=641309 RepID=A0A7S2XDY7_9EUKA|mmetsp:Transcript_27175/g.50727  ORF Transcript_27175/g.50727 Transcript_27175/m.50727 type:complete len:348 (+) Transcript_27175:32-1075(+)
MEGYDELAFHGLQDNKSAWQFCVHCKTRTKVDEGNCDQCGQRFSNRRTNNASTPSDEGRALPFNLLPGLRFALSDEDALQRSIDASLLEARNSSKPTSKAFIDNLMEEELTQAHLLPVVLRTSVIEKDIRCCRAKFGGLRLSSDGDSGKDSESKASKSSKVVVAESRIVRSEPFHGNGDLKNKAELKGSICLMLRGKVTFAEKAKAAEAAGCSALIVVQSKDQPWPYHMTDSSNATLKIPVVMISGQDGTRLSEAIEKKKGDKVDASIFFIGVHLSCTICREDFQIDKQKEKAASLPCGHLFHVDCIKPWLMKRNVCPLCRYSLPSSEVKSEDRRRLRERLGAEMFH